MAKKNNNRRHKLSVTLSPIYIELVDGLKEHSGNAASYSEDDEGTGTIQIDSALRGKALHSALFHEMFHFALHRSGIYYIMGEKLDEGAVRALENLFLPMLPKIEKILEKLNETETPSV